MKTFTLTLLSLFILLAPEVFAGKKKVNISCSEPDAEIYVNGEQMGRGSFYLVIPA